MVVERIKALLTINKLKLLLRHAAVSVTCASTEFFLFMMLFSHYKLSLASSFVLSFSAASVIGFLGHTYFTFYLNRIQRKNIFYFLTQLFFVAIIGFCFLKFFIYYMEPKYAKLLQLVCTFSFNVVYGRYVSFRR